MFVYDAGIIDYFKGMSQLHDYIRLCYINRNNIENFECFYHTERELKSFLINCFVAVKSTLRWEGDINGDNIAISAVPLGCDAPREILAFKQYNNGSSFIVSDLCLNSVGQGGNLYPVKDLNSQVLLKYFRQSYDLVEDIFEKSLHGLIEISTKDFSDENNILALPNSFTPPSKKDNKIDCNIANFTKI